MKQEFPMGTFFSGETELPFHMFLCYRKFSTGGDTKRHVPSTFQPDFAARCGNHSLQSLKDTYEIPADALFFINSHLIFRLLALHKGIPRAKDRHILSQKHYSLKFDSLYNICYRRIFYSKQISTQTFLHMRYDRTDCALICDVSSCQSYKVVIFCSNPHCSHFMTWLLVTVAIRCLRYQTSPVRCFQTEECLVFNILTRSKQKAFCSFQNNKQHLSALFSNFSPFRVSSNA